MYSVEGRPLDETELVARSANGEAHAFGELVRTHQKPAIRVAYLVLRDHAEAEEVTQDAFLKAYHSLDGFRRGSAFRPWLLRIVRNEALNRIRGSKRRRRREIRVFADPVSGDAAPSPEAAAIDQQTHEEVLLALQDLPARFREVITHRFLLDLSEAETAVVLGIKQGTVKSRTSRGLARLRKALEETS